MKIESNLWVYISTITVLLIFAGCNKIPEPGQHSTDTSSQAVNTHSSDHEIVTEIFKVRATVTKIDRQSGRITLDHQIIPGFMDSMTMTSALADTSTIDHLHVGSIGLFTLRVKNKTPLVTDVEPYSGKNSNLKGEEAKTYRVLAKVTAINKTEGTITIDHEKMEGFMNAMEMPYNVGDLSLLEKVAVGTEGHFTIRVVHGEGTITAIHVHK